MFIVNEAHTYRHGEVKGGFVTIKDGKVWKGAVRSKKSNALLWTCEHIHSRPEYNARYRRDTRRVWEYSAMNCGLRASEQWFWVQDKRSENVTGKWGLIDTLPPGNSMGTPRDDWKMAIVGGVTYEGMVKLNLEGNRRLQVVHEDMEPVGFIDLDDLKNTLLHPKVSGASLKRWLTAAGLLQGTVWGLTFQNPAKPVRARGILMEEVERLTPADHDIIKKGPHIRRLTKGFAVVDESGTEVLTVPHRGRAMKELNKLIGESQS